MGHFTSIDAAEPFTTLDGSTIREIAHPSSSEVRNQSLAQATLEPGQQTTEHYHRRSEELYLFTTGRARVALGAEWREVGPGDCVVIAPGTPHQVVNPGDDQVRFLCCCSPPYADADTVLVASPPA